MRFFSFSFLSVMKLKLRGIFQNEGRRRASDLAIPIGSSKV